MTAPLSITARRVSVVRVEHPTRVPFAATRRERQEALDRGRLLTGTRRVLALRPAGRRPRHPSRVLHPDSAFTLIELIMAMAGSALILAAVFGVFGRAVHMRDDATARTRDARVRSHALAVMRNDLSNARITEGLLATVLKGSQTSPGGEFPGYLKFTTTTASDDQDLPTADIQKVEYFVATDPDTQDQRAGRLVRTVQRDLLTEVPGTPTREPLLSGVQAMELGFYDGTDWQEEWEYDATNNPEVPKAVRVRIQLATAPGERAPAPIELLVPWTTEVTKP